MIEVNGKPFDVVYPENYYVKRLRPEELRKARAMAEAIYTLLRPTTVVEWGCAIAAELHYLELLGVKVKGLDASTYAVQHGLVEVEQADLRKPYSYGKKYDICICFETIEHIRQEYEAVVLKNLVSASDIVLISVPWKVGGLHHVNEQPPEYWVGRFRKLGYYFDDKMTQKLKTEVRGGKGWIIKNLQVFRRMKK